jgi:hypothetical protein
VCVCVRVPYLRPYLLLLQQPYTRDHSLLSTTHTHIMASIVDQATAGVEKLAVNAKPREVIIGIDLGKRSVLGGRALQNSFPCISAVCLRHTDC